MSDIEDMPDDTSLTAMSIENYKAATRRAEAEVAKYRAQIKAAEQGLAEAKERMTVLAELQAEGNRLKRLVLVDKVARLTGLPETLRTRLQGETEAELLEDAQRLTALLTNAQPMG